FPRKGEIQKYNQFSSLRTMLSLSMDNLKSSILKLGFVFAVVIKITNAANSPSSSNYYVSYLPGLPDNADLKMHAG
ncbi:31449_t:CDS:2, partial [Gigaspora margarita]